MEQGVAESLDDFRYGNLAESLDDFRYGIAAPSLTRPFARLNEC